MHIFINVLCFGHTIADASIEVLTQERVAGDDLAGRDWSGWCGLKLILI